MNWVLAKTCALLIRVIGITLRLEIIDHAGIIGVRDRAPVIFAFWHNRILLPPYLHPRHCPGHRCIALISRSRDGEFISAVAREFGVDSARGSSSRHGLAAAVKAIHAMQQQKMDISVTPDGPRGPCYQVQPGIFHLAQATGQPIVPLTTHLQWKIELGTWDKFQIPLPFSRCRLVLQAPIWIPAGEDAAALKKRADFLVHALAKES